MHSLPLALLERISGRVAVVGSLNADLTVRTVKLPRPGQTVTGEDLQVLPGGKSANQAVQAALLGAQTALIGLVGRDSHGDLLVQSLTRAGVDVEAVGRAEQPTGTAVITVDHDGENTIVVSPGANGVVDAALVRDHCELITQAQVLGLCLEVGLEAVTEAAQIAAAAGTVVVLNPSPFRADLPAALLGATDVLVLNEPELAELASASRVDDFGGAEFREWAVAAVQGLGVARAVVTLGSRGSIVIDDGEAVEIRPFPTQAVDTTGAGDSFLAALMTGIASGFDLEAAATLASAVSSVATRSTGAQASYRDAATLRAMWA